MSQHDFDLATADANTGVTVRAGMNAMAQALASNNSGVTEPSTKYANMWWADTTADMLKQRNAGNTAWINKGKLSDIAYGAGALQTQTHQTFTPAGTADAITGTLSPAVTANTNNLRVFWNATANTTTTPTLNVGGGAAVIKKKDATGALVAVAVGDIAGPVEAVYNTAGVCWVLLTPFSYGRNSILGTVSQTAGVPTGSIIARGSNANGEYVRFADGTQICTSGGDNSVVANIATGSIFNSNGSTWTYPSSFIVAPVVTGAARDSTKWATIAGTSTTDTIARLYADVSDATSTIINLTAIGRWF